MKDAKTRTGTSNLRSSDLEQCFICNQWQSLKYMRDKTFNGIEEKICIKCFFELKKREDSLQALEMELRFQEEAEDEMYQQALEGVSDEESGQG